MLQHGGTLKTEEGTLPCANVDLWPEGVAEGEPLISENPWHFQSIVVTGHYERL